MITTLFHPEVFQGRGKRRAYFEGWYFKVLNESATRAYAFIPGVAMDEQGNRHSFIQVLDGKKRTSDYHTFTIDSFVAATDIFSVTIGENRFSKDSISLDLPGIKGTLHFTNCTPWPSTWYSPGIMGPFTFVPFMECYHGIVSMDHAITGQLKIDGDSIDFEKGRGYIEKDWGRSFPKAYVWMQSNHFSTPGISLKASVAKIPWVGKSFVGFIAGIRIHDHLLQFTTYNSSSLRKLEITAQRIELVLENRRHLLEIAVARDAATALASPIQGFMNGRIEESMTALMDVRVTDRKSGSELLRDKGRNSAVEVAGAINEIEVPGIRCANPLIGKFI